MADTLEDLSVDLKIDTEDGDHDTLTHYARKTEILRARVEGIPCKALCGKEWIPAKDETKYPLCQTCKEIYESLAE